MENQKSKASVLSFLLPILVAAMFALTFIPGVWVLHFNNPGGVPIRLCNFYTCIFPMPALSGILCGASLLPILLFSAAYGVGPGLLTGLVYGVLQYLQGGWFLNVWQFALDYLLAFAALGLAGLSRKLPEKWGLYAAMVIAAVGRALSATLAGIMFWETAPVASLVYNVTYLIPEIVICIILAVIIAKPVMRIMKAASR